MAGAGACQIRMCTKSTAAYGGCVKVGVLELEDGNKAALEREKGTEYLSKYILSRARLVSKRGNLDGDG